jgi:hypothetical protein
VLQVAPEFESVTEPGEKILWQGKPVFVPFMLHAFPILGLAIFWGAFYLGLGDAGSGNAAPPPTAYLIIFLIMRSLPVWGSILYCVYLVLVYGNTLYAYTNRRMLMRGGLGGLFGTSFKSIDYDRIQELDVTVGLLDRLFDVGTVRAFSGSLTSKGARIYDRFVSIRDPYGVYRAIKGVPPGDQPGIHDRIQALSAV